MFTHPPHLHIRRPSPTTTEFLITTSPPRSLLTHTFLTIRILLLLALLALTIFPPPSYPSHIRLPLTAAGAYLLLQRVTTQESLLVISQLGIQTSTTAGTLWGQKPKTRFIPATEVMGVWVNEGFVGFGVRFYLCVGVRGEGGVVVVFPTLLPRRKLLERVWRGVGGCM